MNRRQFLKTTTAAAVATLASTGCASGATRPSSTRSTAATTTSRPIGSNNDLRVAVIGFNGQGRAHIGWMKKMRGVRLVALCDVDEAVLNPMAEKLEKDDGIRVERFRDLRKLLDSKEIDAVTIATPNHWHAAATVFACQAGKDVYVEKPAAHSIWEGRRMVEAARKYKRVVQVGLNNRSRPSLDAAFAYLHSGAIGKIKSSRAWDFKRRQSIGRVSGPQKIPQTIDYDLWCGPAPLLPLTRTNLHYDWHWQWPWGNGEIGNNGTHQLDMLRWGLGKENLPKSVTAFGGRYLVNDDGDTPNTHVVLYDYDGIPVIYEARALPSSSTSQNMDDVEGTAYGSDKTRVIVGGKAGVGSGFAIFCEGGYLVDATVRDNEGKTVKEFGPREDGIRPPDAFVRAVRSRKIEDLRTDILQGHLSACLCHIGNIALQCGESVSLAKAGAALRSDGTGAAALDRMLQHLTRNGVDTSTATVTLGPSLVMDSKAERFVGDGSERANWFLRESHREPFAIPERL
jgi:predicted dehydrogenase